MNKRDFLKLKENIGNIKSLAKRIELAELLLKSRIITKPEEYYWVMTHKR